MGPRLLGITNRMHASLLCLCVSVATWFGSSGSLSLPFSPGSGSVSGFSEFVLFLHPTHPTYLTRHPLRTPCPLPTHTYIQAATTHAT